MYAEPGTYLAAALVGFLGGVHCAGMCGGIVGALTLGVRTQENAPKTALLPYLLAYNLGRILTYTLLGALVGGVGLIAANLAHMHDLQRGLHLLAGLFMVALGLYIAGWWRGLSYLERGGGVIWRRLEPLGRTLLPVHRPRQALLLGLLWGFLPCGLVYSVLFWALSATDWLKGALLMLCFGLGTLPNLLLMGGFAVQLRPIIKHPAVRIGAGLLVLLFGVYMLGQLL
ncbi:sulfite exporter TauE/SafE family protein [Thiorhodospira sibirica]|uniref:sulfite exporter TauE/SafE family protein n=1 Tax=Thiorhodospira sibirica TaxID=154347 RepID=UPI00022C1186|nr:sulfite exporter TauE/SafE family protein [Thiorhodospira sibirica]